jgi:hypothetical protein
VTLEGWTKIMDMFADAYIGWFVNIYYIIFIMICNFFVLQLTIAVMLNKYEEILVTEQNSNFRTELIQYGQKLKLPLELVEFIVEHNNVGVSKNRRAKGLFKYYTKKTTENFYLSST